MPKPISPRLHGVLDYATVALTAAAPALLGLSKPASRTFYALSGGYLGLSLLTDYPLAARRAVPFPVHGVAEGALGALLPLAPWAFGFRDDRRAQTLVWTLTAVTGVVAALTDWTRREA